MTRPRIWPVEFVDVASRVVETPNGREHHVRFTLPEGADPVAPGDTGRIVWVPGAFFRVVEVDATGLRALAVRIPDGGEEEGEDEDPPERDDRTGDLFT